jgi:hypothetical protein
VKSLVFFCVFLDGVQGDLCDRAKKNMILKGMECGNPKERFAMLRFRVGTAARRALAACRNPMAKARGWQKMSPRRVVLAQIAKYDSKNMSRTREVCAKIAKCDAAVAKLSESRAEVQRQQREVDNLREFIIDRGAAAELTIAPTFHHAQAYSYFFDASWENA